MKPVQIWNRIWRKRLSLVRRPQPPSSSSLLPEFRFLNVTGRPNGWNDPRFEKLWLYNLHYFDCLVREGILTQRHGDTERGALILRWIRENPKGWGNGWEPYPISLRVVNWVKWLLGAKTEIQDEQRRIIADSLREQVEWLCPRLEYHLLANHLLANAKALVFAGAYFLTQGHGDAEGRRFLRKGLAIYEKELPEQVLTDGVHFERSPMYHCIILEDVLDCSALLKSMLEAEAAEAGHLLAGVCRRDGGSTIFSNCFKEYAEKMLAGLRLLTGPDGKIAKFNDATEGIARTPAELFSSAGKLGLKALDLRSLPLHQPSTSPSPTTSSGFVRIENSPYCLIAKMGEIGPDYQPGHAHADTGTFELWKGERKIVGDTGCSTYVPGAIRSSERSTAAHNAVIVDGENSSEVWAAHRVARRGKILTQRHGDTECAVAYRDFRGFEIRRTLKLAADGLHGVDEVRGTGSHEVEIRWHLPPGVGKDEVAIACPGELTWEPCEFAEGWNRRKAGVCAVFRARVTLPAKFDWTIV